VLLLGAWSVFEERLGTPARRESLLLTIQTVMAEMMTVMVKWTRSSRARRQSVGWGPAGPQGIHAVKKLRF